MTFGDLHNPKTYSSNSENFKNCSSGLQVPGKGTMESSGDSISNLLPVTH